MLVCVLYVVVIDGVGGVKEGLDWVLLPIELVVYTGVMYGVQL